MSGTRPFKVRRILIISGVVVGVTLSLAVAFYLLAWDFRQSARAIVSGLSPIGLTNDCDRVIISRSPLLVADYYQASDDQPLIIMVHGSSRLGRRSALVRTLAQEFRQRGFPVLAVDLRGFGESSDPPVPLRNDLGFERDVASAAEFALERGLAAGGRFAYVGHSLGAGVVLRAGRLEPRPNAVVALSPPLTIDRFERAGRSSLDRFAAARLREMELPRSPESVAVMGRYLLEIDALAQVAKPDNPPVLLVRGEFEKRHRVSFLRKHLPRTKSPIGLLEVSRAPHAYDIVGLRRLDFVFRDPEVIDQLVRAVDDWVSDWSHLGRPTRPFSVAATRLATTPWPDLGNVGRWGKWSKFELTLAGPPSIGTSDKANPFALQLNVRFQGPTGEIFVIPGFYDGDGDGGPDGCIWRVRFAPNRTGAWSFVTSGNHPLFDNYHGRFFVDPPPEDAPVFERWGRLLYVGEHYLRFADGPYWIKGGADEPEDFLAPGVLGDWDEKKRAIDYLSAQGVNSIYLMLHNVGGDGDNVWPWISRTDTEHFDLAKLAEWEGFFEHVQRRGLVLHLVLEDDSGWTGFNRSMYYREMIARFGHINAMYWNISEEYSENYSAQRVIGFADRVRRLDPYNHPITVHNVQGPDEWDPFLGDKRFEVTSLQTRRGPQNAETIRWRERSEAAGRPLVVSFDEAGRYFVHEREAARQSVWSVYLGGGSVELFTREVREKGFEAFEEFWGDLYRARSFMEALPFWQMEPANELLLGEAHDQYCFAKPGQVYAIYLQHGGDLSLDLTDAPGRFASIWFDPRSGRRFPGGPVDGGEPRLLGPAPFAGDAAFVLTVDHEGLPPDH